MLQHKSQAVIIGAGMGGLAAAISLARAGWRVTVLEKLSRPGGKMGQVVADGYCWDTGPSVITMRHVFEKLFHDDSGASLSDYVSLQQLDPITRYFWPDGATIDAVSNPHAMHENIRCAGFDARDADGYLRFMKYVARLYQIISDPFLHRAQPSLRDMLRLPVADVLKIDALRDMHTAVRAHFHDPHMIQLFDRFATYNGSSPHLVPATLNVIAHVEMAQGAWYPRGGVFALAEAAHHRAKELGVEIVYDAQVNSIELQGKRVVGVRLQNGGFIAADVLICNSDFAWTQRELLPKKRSARSTLQPSCSGYVMLIKNEAAQPKLAHHNIFFCSPQRYHNEFDDIFERQIPPRDPTLYVCITSKSDSQHAPPGCENWFVLANMPHLTPEQNWPTQEATVRAAHLATLDSRLLIHAISNQALTVHDTWTPQKIQDTYFGNFGAIYGFSSNSRMAAFARPGNRSRKLKGLYYAGGSVHPGGGVPLAALSGMAAARCAIEDKKELRG